MKKIKIQHNTRFSDYLEQSSTNNIPSNSSSATKSSVNMEVLSSDSSVGMTTPLVASKTTESLSSCQQEANNCSRQGNTNNFNIRKRRPHRSNNFNWRNNNPLPMPAPPYGFPAFDYPPPAMLPLPRFPPPWIIRPLFPPHPFMYPDYRYFPDISALHLAPEPVNNYRNINKLRDDILKQIEFYFSDENLKKDAFLKSNDNMDEEGWVDINLIARFNRVKSMTSDISLILEALQPSRVVEVKGEKVRKLDNWSIYIQPSPSSSAETSSSEDTLIA